MEVTPELEAAIKIGVSQELWRRGHLRFKLHSTQQKIYDAIDASPLRRHFLLCSRRLGKSYLLVCKAFECALRTPNARVLYLFPFAKDAAEIVGDIALKALDDCPESLKPEYRTQTKELAFKNGSLIRFKGTNGEHAQFLRGGAADLAILDECGTMDDLDNVLHSVVEPMTLTTKGRILLATTPAETPGHESATIYEIFSQQGATSEFTLLDAPHIEYEEKRQTLENLGEKPERIPDILAGLVPPETTKAKREYFCQWVTDASSAVVREFDAQAQAEIVKEHPTPEYRDCYVAMDPGMVDKTGILFAYWDFRNAKLVIEDEFVESHLNTLQIADAITKKEKELWGERPPYLRISDIDKRLIADLTQLHSIGFSPANKKDSDAAINKMRVWVASRKLVIHPRCKHLVRQLKNAIWNKRATDFDRSDIDGHYDLVAALKYLVRHINEGKNPFPEWYDRRPSGHGHYVSTRNTRKKRAIEGSLYADTPVGRRLLKKDWK